LAVKVTTTPKASRDLDEWIARIAENNPLAAEAFQNRIRQAEKEFKQAQEIAAAFVRDSEKLLGVAN